MCEHNKTLYIHIGTEKTGTTAIQSTLYANQMKLREYSINYPSIGFYQLAQFSLVSGLIYEETGNYFEVAPPNWKKSKSEEWDELILAIKESECSKHIVCVEHFSSRLGVESIAWIYSTLKETLNINIKIICYFRRQDEYLISSFSTAVKAGDGRTFLKYKLDEELNYKRYNHYQMISSWAEVFGKENIIVKVFERNKLYYQDIVSDLLSILGLDVKNIKLSRPSNQNQINESWHPKTVRLAIFINRNHRLKKKLGSKRLYFLNRINTFFMENYPEMGRKYMGSEQCIKLLDIYHESNKRLANEYFDTDNLFNSKYPEDDELVQFDSIELYDSLDILIKIMTPNS